MYRLRRIGGIIAVFVALEARSQSVENINNYINTYKDLAITEMQRTGVPASITLAQGIHETMAGASKLVQESNNHFGIKCKSNWTGESVRHTDDARNECFRKYPSADDSYRDHSDFLKSSPRYASLFTLDPLDYSDWAYGLKKAGYATNPHYPEVLIKLIEDYHLQDFTLVAMGKKNGENIETTSVEGVTQVSSPPVETKTASPVNWPEGEFRINETKVVFVKAGTSFLALAQKFDIDLSKIFEFNEIPGTEMADADQLIYLQRKRKTGNNEFHIVQPGENLHTIAQQEGIRLESLEELNWLRKGEMPAIGEQLSLKKKSVSSPRLAVKDNYSLLPGTGIKTSN